MNEIEPEKIPTLEHLQAPSGILKPAPGIPEPVIYLLELASNIKIARRFDPLQRLALRRYYGSAPQDEKTKSHNFSLRDIPDEAEREHFKKLIEAGLLRIISTLPPAERMRFEELEDDWFFKKIDKLADPRTIKNQKISDALKRRWENPEYRKAHEEILIAIAQDPIVNIKKSQKMKEKFKDSEYRDNNRRSHTVETKQKIKESMLKSWEFRKNKE